eukprot:875077-Amorphochlora_amoeboformis.AAC.2
MTYLYGLILRPSPVPLGEPRAWLWRTHPAFVCANYVHSWTIMGSIGSKFLSVSLTYMKFLLGVRINPRNPTVPIELVEVPGLLLFNVFDVSFSSGIVDKERLVELAREIIGRNSNQ